MNSTKRFILASMLLGITATTTSLQASAQEQCLPQSEESRTQLATSQASEIASELKLSDELTKKFTDTYVKCQKEMWAAFPDKKLGKPCKKPQELTDQQAEEIIKARFEHRRKMDKLQEKYYNEYRKILTPAQILKMYDLEKKQMRKMVKRNMTKPAKEAKCKSHKKEMPRAERREKRQRNKDKN